MYDPLVQLSAGAGTRVGIAGLGGLGVMGIKLAKALGCTVTALSRTSAKSELAKKCGADNYIATSSAQAMEAAKGSLDIILNTIPVSHDYDQYTRLIAPKGKQVMLGLHSGFIGCTLVGGGIILGGGVSCGTAKVMGSVIGGIRATQEVMNLCAEHSIVPELKVMPCESLNDIFRELDASNDSGVRHVLDIANTLNDGTAAKCTAPAADPQPNSMGICAGICDCFRLLFCCKCR